jgi:hypothetical protein
MSAVTDDGETGVWLAGGGLRYAAVGSAGTAGVQMLPDSANTTHVSIVDGSELWVSAGDTLLALSATVPAATASPSSSPGAASVSPWPHCLVARRASLLARC